MPRTISCGSIVTWVMVNRLYIGLERYATKNNNIQGAKPRGLLKFVQGRDVGVRVHMALMASVARRSKCREPCNIRRNFSSRRTFFDRQLREPRVLSIICSNPATMSSRISLQNPYTVAPLPQPIDRSTGRFMVSDVYGGTAGSKKRKRAELVVGIDGEGVNLYDVRLPIYPHYHSSLIGTQVSAARLVTAYALPPQTTFTCAPCSTRTRISKKQVERRTYVSTTQSEARTQAQLTLFHDVTLGSSTQSSTVSRKLEHSEEPIVYMGTVTATRDSGISDSTFDLLVVKRDGEIQCLDGDKLEDKWTSPANALGRDATPPISSGQVEYVQLTNAYTASQGILKSRQGILNTFQQEITQDGFNPDVLVIITRSDTPTLARNIHVVALPRRSATKSTELKHAVEPLLTATLSTASHGHINESFSIHVSSGILQRLCGDYLFTYDITGVSPKIISKLRLKGSTSFLRLSRTSVIVSTASSLAIYSSKFGSTLASIPLPPEFLSKNASILANGTQRCPCALVSYSPKLGIAIAIANTGLIALQIQGKSRIDGLLIDSLGCSARGQQRPQSLKGSAGVELTTILSYLPGSMIQYEGPSKSDLKAIDEAVTSGDVLQFEELIGRKLPILNNASGKGGAESSQSTSEVDRRWVIYTLSKVFAWSTTDNSDPSLTVSFFSPNTFTWLLRTGNMTLENLELALRDRIHESGLESIPSGELVDAIVEIDPQMDLLFALVSVNYLGAAELLAAIRRLMESLELFGEDAATRQLMLMNEEDSSLESGNIEDQVAELEAEAEADLALAEYQLGPGSGIRGEALSLALSKLYSCPTNSIVHALQTTYSSQEIVSLIYLLRFEMARGAWTSRYLDGDELDVSDDETGVPDSTILLISSLLSNCIDAVGAGGWLAGHARLVSSNRFEAEELIASLKLEVSAALEGLEEAVYLRGLTSEMVRYGDMVRKGQSGGDGSQAEWRKSKPTLGSHIISTSEQEGKFLPLGLKAEQPISKFRVGAGGEVHERSLRDIGRLKSHKVGKYSLERIVV